MNLTEAFSALDKLDEETFSVDLDGIKKLKNFVVDDDSVDELSVYDLEHEAEDEAVGCHEGDVILDCPVCHSKLFKATEDVVVDEDTDTVNVGEECPYCFATGGFKVVGEVASKDESEKENDAIDLEVTSVEVPVVEPKDSSDKEPLKEFFDYDDDGFFSDDADAVDEYLSAAEGYLSHKYPSLKGKHIYLEPSTQNGSGSVFLVVDDRYLSSYIDEDDPGVDYEALLDFVYEEDKKGFIDYIDSTYADILNNDRLFESARRPTRKWHQVTEKVDLITKENTISSVLAANMARLSDIYDVNALKNEIIKILDESNIADKNAVRQFKLRILKGRSADSVLKTIATYMTGMKTVDSELYNKNHGTSKLRKVAVGESRRRAIREDLGSDIDTYQRWVDYDMKRYGRISDITKHEVNEAGLQIIKDQYGDYEVTGGSYKAESKAISRHDFIKESRLRNRRRLIKEDIDAVEIKSDDQVVKINACDDTIKVEVEKDFDDEAKDTSEEIVAPVSAETVEEIEIEDIDSEALEDAMEECFMESYNNVKFFKIGKIKNLSDKIIVEGVLGSKSGKKKNIRAVYESYKTRNNKVMLKGKVNGLNESFILTGSVKKGRLI